MPRKSTKLGRTFGLIIQRRRHALDYTQEVLAKKSEVHRQSIAAYENGYNTPTVITLFQLAKGLKTTPSALMQDLQDSGL